METELYKSRSHSACIKAAYILFSTHLTTVFKRTWFPVLVYSMVLAALIILYMPNKAWTDAGLSTPFERLLIIGGVDVLALASSVWIATVLASLFNGLPKRSNLLHSLLLNVFLAGIILLAAIVLREGDVLAMKALFSMKMSAETVGVASWGILILLATIIGTALLPLAFSLMKYWIEPDMKLSVVFGKAYRRGLRHWGFLFITLFGAHLRSYPVCTFDTLRNHSHGAGVQPNRDIARRSVGRSVGILSFALRHCFDNVFLFDLPCDLVDLRALLCLWLDRSHRTRTRSDMKPIFMLCALRRCRAKNA